jgi:predicted kinase
MRYTRLLITRGLPGSGKSTVARELVQSMTEFRDGKPATFKMIAMSRDEYRRMFNGRRLGLGRQEQLVTAAMDAAVLAVLDLGVDVIVHDTNLRDGDVRHFRKIADQVGAELVVVDLRDVPVDECVRRDQLRVGEDHVGEKVIRDKYAEHIAKPGTATMTLAAAASARATR